MRSDIILLFFIILDKNGVTAKVMPFFRSLIDIDRYEAGNYN